MSKRKTTEEFSIQIKTLHPDIELVSEYVDSVTKIKCHCEKCDYDWVATPRTIMTRGCLKCAGSVTRKISESEYQTKLYEIHSGNIVSLEDYSGMNVSILHKCIVHNYKFNAKPVKILSGQGCKFCGLEKIGNSKRDDLDTVKNKIFNAYGEEFELLDSNYKNNNSKMLFLHKPKFGKPHTFYSTTNSILSGQGCGACHGSQVSVGYNDIATTNPYVASLFANQDESRIYTEWSSSKVDFKCPDCGHIRKKVISQVSRDNDICCPVCGDGYSYPNKFIYNCLLQVDKSLDFLYREYTPKWCRFDFYGRTKTGTYDIYLSINKSEYIVEMDGGLGHGNKCLDISKEDSIFIDNEKDKLASQHGIKVIRIDCNYGSTNKFEFIKNNILSSELSNIIDMSKIKFNEANIEAQSSLFIKCCHLWNTGYNAQEIAKEINVVGSTVTNYLINGTKYGLCDNYSSKESMYRSHGREIVCLNTKKKFRSIVDGARCYGILASDISKCCRRKSSYGGIYNGEKMIWLYYDEYEEMTDNDLLYYAPKENNCYTKVICLNTGEIFNKIQDAAKWCGLRGSSGIVSCCNNKYFTSGKHPITREPLKWKYYDDYLKSTAS